MDRQRFVVALTTAGSDAEAEQIARGLVEQRLAACVNVLPCVRSIYRWKGEVHADDERLLLIKTTHDRVEEVREAVRALHSYELPEFLVLPVQGGDPSYLAWLAEGLETERV